MDEVIERFQENLLLIRRTVGWSADQFGEKIGVTRQTINNLERKDTNIKLNKTIYIAMRAVLADEIHNSKDDTHMLSSILEIFVDHPENYDEKAKQELLSKANMIAPSILAKDSNTSRKDASDMWCDILAGLIAIGTSAALVAIFGNSKTFNNTFGWLTKTSGSSTKKLTKK